MTRRRGKVGRKPAADGGGKIGREITLDNANLELTQAGFRESLSIAICRRGDANCADEADAKFSNR